MTAYEHELKLQEIEEWKAEHPGEELPEYYRSGEFWDSHSCYANASSYGICQICGAIIRGSNADYDIHGYDPPEPDDFFMYDDEW